MSDFKIGDGLEYYDMKVDSYTYVVTNIYFNKKTEEFELQLNYKSNTIIRTQENIRYMLNGGYMIHIPNYSQKQLIKQLLKTD